MGKRDFRTSFADTPFILSVLLPIQRAWQLVDISKKADGESLPVLITRHLKGGEEPGTSGSPL
jgi:hypothetical protein